MWQDETCGAAAQPEIFTSKQLGKPSKCIPSQQVSRAQTRTRSDVRSKRDLTNKRAEEAARWFSGTRFLLKGQFDGEDGRTSRHLGEYFTISANPSDLRWKGHKSLV